MHRSCRVLTIVMFAMGCVTSPTTTNHSPAKQGFDEAAIAFYQQFPADWLPLTDTGYPVPTARIVDTANLPTRGSAPEATLVTIVVVCEAGCPACETRIPEYFDVIALFDHVRVSFEHVVRFHKSDEMHEILTEVASDEQRWEAFDRLFGIGQKPQSIAAVRTALGLKPRNKVPPRRRAELALSVENASKASDDAYHWFHTPTIYVNGAPLVGFDARDLLVAIPQQAHLAWQVHKRTGLLGHKLYTKVAEINRQADVELRRQGQQLKEQCAAGSADACGTYAIAILKGTGREPGDAAQHAFQRGCALGHVMSCAMTGQNVTRDAVIGACHGGDVFACGYAIAHESDTAAKLELAKVGCEHGSLNMCAVTAATTGTENPATVVDRLKTLCVARQVVASCMILAQFQSKAEALALPPDEFTRILYHGVTFDTARDFDEVIKAALRHGQDIPDLDRRWRAALVTPRR